LLLSFLLPSYIVVPERISVNISFPFDINTNTNSQKSFTGMIIDIKVDTSRDWFVSLSYRATLVHSDMSFMVYIECVQVLANNST